MTMLSAEARARAAEGADVRAGASGAAPRMRCWRRRPAIEQGADDILVIFGDTPLIRPQTLERLRAALAGGAASRCSAFGPPIRPATAGW